MPILRLLNKLLGFSLTGSALGTSIGVKITKGWKSVLKHTKPITPPRLLLSPVEELY